MLDIVLDLCYNQTIKTKSPKGGGYKNENHDEAPNV
jgi:hypothetical protein